MSFLLGFIVGVIFTIFAVLIWWYIDAGLVTGILQDDQLMQRQGREDDRKKG